MKKSLVYSVTAITLAAGSLFLASPAFANASGTASSMSVAQGGTFTATVTNQNPIPAPGDEWCNSVGGPGYSMAVLLWPTVKGAPIVLPSGADVVGVAGLGNFTWGAAPGEATSVNVTIPADTPVGTYDLFYGCVSASPGYLHPGNGAAVVGSFTVTAAPAAPLPDTGSDNGAMAWTIGAVSATLLALGAGLFFVRRRLS
ncbi:MAG: LPXTG cell wall anchor domain-containing protein [Actinobacteria bacterium]|nr:LPXTG cell wall anchor domain-containing protein [Actinomycetota bacterium]